MLRDDERAIGIGFGNGEADVREILDSLPIGAEISAG